jgi:hypothetical protein
MHLKDGKINFFIANLVASQTLSDCPTQSSPSKPLGFPGKTQDPFLFCVHHEDFYPKGNDEMGPSASLAGRNIGNDFAINKDHWRCTTVSAFRDFLPILIAF